MIFKNLLNFAATFKTQITYFKESCLEIDENAQDGLT